MNCLTHSEHRSFMCEDCGDTFKQRPALYTHCKLVHQGNLLNSQFVPLVSCSIRISSNSQLVPFPTRPCNMNCLTHSEQRSFMCEDCGDTFKQRPALYTHCKLVHQGLKRKYVRKKVA
ncbi:hypothetical protein NE865_10112 [Phthorimaea operculella]|nr:hypothetical protein NE865_10112 [Phthorimaea operculella]